MIAGKYKVRWSYDKLIGQTICLVQDTGDIAVVGVGIAAKSPKDLFNKDKARKVSFLRAMKDMGLTKPKRKEMWEAYRNMTLNKRW